MRYHKYTHQEDLIIMKVYPKLGIQGTREFLPHLTDERCRKRARTLGVSAPQGSPKARSRYASLKPLDPEAVLPSKWDNPIIKHKAVGQWKAEIPTVRWVFDLVGVQS